MKLLASIPLLAIGAQAGIVEYLEHEMGQKFVETRDGFKLNLAPYFTLVVEAEGAKGQLKTSANGVDMDEDNWELEGNTLKQWGEGHGSNWLNVSPMMREIKTYEYEMESSFSMAGLSLGADWAKSVDFTYNQGGSGSVSNVGEIEVNASMNNNKATVDISTDIKQTSNNVNRLRKYDLYDIGIAPWTWSSEGDFKVKSISACTAFLENFSGSPCNVEFKNKINMNGRQKKFMAEMKLAQYAVVLKFGSGRKASEMFFLRSVDNNDNLSALNALQFFELYHTNRAGNWQSVLKNGAASLLLRAPLCSAIEDHVAPALEAFVEPFVKFVEAAAENWEKIPYIIYYMDDLFADFDDQFDLSAVVAATRIESEPLADMVGARNGLNEWMQGGCEDMNDSIVEALQCDELDNAMGEMRSYVSDMASSSGAQEFERLFGNHF